MALFQKKPDAGGDVMPIFRLGVHKTILIIGLGNVGKEFEGTRHNIGFDCLDSLAASQNLDPWIQKKDLKSIITMGTIGESRVILCKPTTMMNLSGEAAEAVRHFYKIDPGSIIAVYDEIDVDFGQIRTRIGGSSAGHNGVKSLIQHLGEDFGRVRVGIGPKKPAQMDNADYVLAKFSEKEQKQLKNLLQESNAILTEYIHGGQLMAETRSFIF